jgi:hypothetical protein
METTMSNDLYIDANNNNKINQSKIPSVITSIEHIQQIHKHNRKEKHMTIYKNIVK